MCFHAFLGCHKGLYRRSIGVFHHTPNINVFFLHKIRLDFMPTIPFARTGSHVQIQPPTHESSQVKAQTLTISLIESSTQAAHPSKRAMELPMAADPPNEGAHRLGHQQEKPW